MPHLEPPPSADHPPISDITDLAIAYLARGLVLRYIAASDVYDAGFYTYADDFSDTWLPVGRTSADAVLYLKSLDAENGGVA